MDLVKKGYSRNEAFAPDVNVIHIPFYMFRSQTLGVFLRQFKPGFNIIFCDYKLKDGRYEYPMGIGVDRDEAIKVYGLSKIQDKSPAKGISFPMSRFKDAQSNC